MPDYQFNNPTALLFDAALKAAADGAPKQAAWYATFAANFDRPALYLIDSNERSVILQTTKPWTRNGDTAVITNDEVQVTAAAAVSIESIVRVDLRRGTALMEIDRTKLNLVMPAGQTTFPAGQSTATISAIVIGLVDLVATDTTPSEPVQDGVPAAILAMPSAPFPTSGQYTTKTSTTENWVEDSNGEWGSWLRRAGTRIQLENNMWNTGGNRYQLQFVANPDAALSATQFHTRIGAGNAVGNSVSVHLVGKLPTQAQVQAAKGPGAGSEVVGYPSIGAGQLYALSHRQSARIPNVPIQLKNIRSHWIGAKSWALSGNHGPGWIAHDMRVSRTATQWGSGQLQQAIEDMDAEFMITHRHFPADHNTGPTAGSGTMAGIHTIAGTRFRLWCMVGASRWGNGVQLPLIQFRAIDGAPNYVNGKAVIDFCLNRTYRSIGVTNPRHMARGRGPDDTIFSPDHWWHQVFTGIELEYGDYDLKIDTYTVRVNED